MIKRVLSLGIIAAATAGVALLPVPTIDIGQNVEYSKLSVAPQALQLICPGAAMNSGGAGGTVVGEFDRLGAATISKQVATGATLTSTAAGGATLLSVTGIKEQGSAVLNAGQLQNAASARLNGLLGASCQAPSAEQWLLGGDTSTGRETLLLLSNPAGVPTTVNLEVYAEGGRVQAAGLSGIAVSAGSTQVVPLSSLIPETRSFAVHVASRGAAVGAWLQQRTVRGLLYAGADVISPLTDISKSLSIPGILVRGSKDAAALIAINSDYADLQPALRVFNPSTKTANFTAQIFGANAKTFGTVIHDSVPAGSVKDFAITGLADGDYAASITSDQNIAASVRLPRSNKSAKPNTDFTWLQAGQQLTGTQSITAPAAGITKLSLQNPNIKAISVSVNGTSYSIAAAGVVVIPAAAGKSISIISNDTPVVANLVIDVSGAVTNFALVDYRNSGSSVAVKIR